MCGGMNPGCIIEEPRMEVDLFAGLKMFVDEMERKLREKQKEYGDSWKNMSLDRLALRLVEEFSEVFVYSSAEQVGHELVDVANMALMLWLRLRSSRYPFTTFRVTNGPDDS